MKRIYWFIAALLTCGLIAYAEDRYSDLQNFTKVLNLIQQYYVDEVDTKKLIYGAVKGMLRELDPHTNFMPPEMFKDFESETSGEFGGIGIEISVQDGVLTIISPIEDTPAWEAGIKPSDKIIAIDGTSTKGYSLVEASQKMRGKRGQKIVLTIVRDGQDDPQDITIVRGSVKIKSVKYTDLEDGYAYVRITSFIENTFKDLDQVLRDHVKKSGAVKGLIIDLRKNPGGLLDQAVKVSDLFLDHGTIVSTIGRNRADKEVISATKKDSDLLNFPLIVLIDEHSASASEIVSGALQDNKRALVMGRRSFGKGSVQSVIKLGDGSGLKLTVARYYTPSGVSIQAEGIKPDVEIEEVDQEAFGKSILHSKAMREKDMVGHLENEKEKAKKKSAIDKSDTAWWKEKDKKSDAKSPKEKLISSDWEVYQAFNYLKAWGGFKNLDNGKTTLVK